MTAREIYDRMTDFQKFAFLDRCHMRWPSRWNDDHILIGQDGEYTPLGAELRAMFK